MYKMPKTKTKSKSKVIQEAEPQSEEYPMIPPEVHFLSDKYLVKLPLSQVPQDSAWDLRLHIAGVLEQRLGDHVEVKSLKVKKPRLIAKSKARLLKREPVLRAYVTVEF